MSATPIQPPAEEPASRRWRFWLLGMALAALLAAAIGLWARHGAAVFFDMLAAGIAYCF